MNELIAQLFAALAALSMLTGSPLETNKMPDRPAIVQPAAPKALPAANSNKPATQLTSGTTSRVVDDTSKLNRIEVRGTIQSIKTNNGATTVVVDGQSVVINATTTVNGKLAVGAKVQIEGTKQGNTIVASDVKVNKADSTIKPDDKQPSTTIKSDDKKPEDQSKDDSHDDSKKDDGKKDDSKKDDGSGKGSDDSSKGKSDDSGKNGSSDDGQDHK